MTWIYFYFAFFSYILSLSLLTFSQVFYQNFIKRDEVFFDWGGIPLPNQKNFRKPNRPNDFQFFSQGLCGIGRLTFLTISELVVRTHNRKAGRV